MKKIFLFILLVISITLYSNSRFAYSIKDKDGNFIGHLIKIYDMEDKKNEKIIDIITIGDEYFCFINNFSEEYHFKKNKNLLKIKNSKFAKGKGYAFGFSMVKDTGIEHKYEIISKIGSNNYKFNIFGDMTYIYLKDEDGNVFIDEKAIEYIINKDENLKKYLNIIAVLEKGNLTNLDYIFYVKNVIKKLEMENNNFNLEKIDLSFAKAEEELKLKCGI